MGGMFSPYCTIRRSFKEVTMKKLISLLLIISTPAYADNAVTVHTDDVVTKQYDGGTLLDKEKANKVKDQLIDADACTKENDSYQKSVLLYQANDKIYQDENSLLLNRNVELTKDLNSSRQTSDLEKIGYIILGAAMLYGGSRLVR